MESMVQLLRLCAFRDLRGDCMVQMFLLLFLPFFFPFFVFFFFRFLLLLTFHYRVLICEINRGSILRLNLDIAMGFTVTGRKARRELSNRKLECEIYRSRYARVTGR